MRYFLGFTLLEIMISLALGSLLFFGLLNIFTSSKFAYGYIDGLALIQENGQIVSLILTKEIAQTGYIGCRKATPTFPITIAVNTADNNLSFIQGYQAGDLPTSLSSIAAKVISNSDVLAIQFMQSSTTNLAQPVKNSDRLTLSASNFFEPDDIVMLADCLEAHIINLTTISGNQATSNTPLKYYPAGSILGLWKNEWFYIGKTGRMNQANQDILALYLSQPNAPDEELVDNISNMHIQYGYLNAEQQLVFVPSEKIPNWSMIKAVKIILLLNSEEPILSQPQIIQFDQHKFFAQDNKLYRSWELIIPLLNR